MSTTLTLTANKSALISYGEYSTRTDTNDHVLESYELSQGTIDRSHRALVAGFPLPSSDYDYKAITSAQVQAWMTSSYGGTGAGNDVRVYCDLLEAEWDEATVTSRTVSYATGTRTGISNSGSEYASFSFSAAASVRKLLLYGCEIFMYPGALYYVSIASSRSSTPPQILVTFSDGTAKPTLSTPNPATGVRLNKAQAQTFSAQMLQNGASIKLLTPANGTFEYRLKDATTSTTAAASISGRVLSYTAAASTFAAGEYEYRFTVTDNLGQTASTSWSSFDTRDTLSTATADEPSGSLCDGDQKITFQWTHINESGSAQTKAELQTSTDGSTWTALATVGGAEVSSYSAPAGKLASGTWFWRVRTYNLDSAAGEWSNTASFVVVAAPTTPKLNVQASPRPLITWQTNEQSAYQIQIDQGVADVTAYGSGKSWRSPVYLTDGTHSARVRVQNSYGLWSAWGSMAFAVSHSEGDAVTLTVDTDFRAALSWSYSGSWTDFVVYRDGVAIAKTTDTFYTDDYSAGAVKYQVRACASDGSYDYSLSNEVTASVMPETIALSAVGSGEWLLLKLSTAQHRTSTVKATRTFSLTQMSGLRYPEAELSELYSRSISVSYATDDADEKAALEALAGSPVCLKTPGGKMVVGILDTLSETESMFYSAYTFAVSQMNYPEEVDLDA